MHRNSCYRIIPILLWGFEKLYAHCHLKELNFYSLQCEWDGYYPAMNAVEK